MVNFFMKVFLLLLLFYVSTSDTKEIFKYKYRAVRQCKSKTGLNTEETLPFYRKNILENPLALIFIIFLSILFFLMFLGLCKGLLGIFVLRCIGEFGLGLLVDLPKPLDKYEEPELKNRPVRYDVAGWPVHPDSGQRTVRLLPVKTEFCLNFVFFLAYPLALILKLCALCCCIRDYNPAESRTSNYKKVDVVRFMEAPYKKGTGPTVDIYNEEDDREEQDTKYVKDMIRKSQESLRENA